MDTRTRKDGRAVKRKIIAHRRCSTRPLRGHPCTRSGCGFAAQGLICRRRSGAAARSAGHQRHSSHPSSLREGGDWHPIPAPFPAMRVMGKQALAAIIPASRLLRTDPSRRGATGWGANHPLAWREGQGECRAVIPRRSARPLRSAADRPGLSGSRAA